MHNMLADRAPKAVIPRGLTEVSEQYTSTALPNAEIPSYRAFSIMLASLPLISFLAQYAFSVRAGTERIMLRHVTVTGLDWIFVPINFYVTRVIDWRRGVRLYVVVVASVVLTILAHAFWQSHGLDPGHMITSSGVVLPAGWVHLGFSILEMVLLVAFVFCRKLNAPELRIVSVLATAYFVAVTICSYLIHGAFLITDVIVGVSGFFFIVIYPKLVGHEKSEE